MGKWSFESPLHAQELCIGSSSRQLRGGRRPGCPGVPAPGVSSDVPGGSPLSLLGLPS